MANSVLLKHSLVVRHESGEQDKDGNLVYEQTKFSNIKLQAYDNNLLAVGNAIGGILDCDSFSLRKEESYLVEDRA